MTSLRYLGMNFQESSSPCLKSDTEMQQFWELENTPDNLVLRIVYSVITKQSPIFWISYKVTYSPCGMAPLQGREVSEIWAIKSLKTIYNAFFMRNTWLFKNSISFSRYDTDAKGYLTHQNFLQKLGIEFAPADTGLSRHSTEDIYTCLKANYNNQ